MGTAKGAVTPRQGPDKAVRRREELVGRPVLGQVVQRLGGLAGLRDLAPDRGSRSSANFMGLASLGLEPF